MEFVIEKKSLDSAVKQVLFGRRDSSEEPVDLTAKGDVLVLAAIGTSVEIPINCMKTGRLSIAVSDLFNLQKISKSYKPGPVHIRVDDGRIYFEKTSLRYRHSAALAKCVEEPNDEPRPIDIPNDASVLDLFSLPAIFTTQEIGACGLQARVKKAQEAVVKMTESAVSSMSEFGFTSAEVTAMTEAKLNSHAAIMRRVLFPDLQPAECNEEQDTRSSTISSVEARTGEIEMNEAEMKAELERLRAENAQLKTKEKGGITLKVSDKGAVSLYGMGRFPVTLYKEQWLRILAAAPDIEKFIQENESKLKTKE